MFSRRSSKLLPQQLQCPWLPALLPGVKVQGVPRRNTLQQRQRWLLHAGVCVCVCVCVCVFSFITAVRSTFRKHELLPKKTLTICMHCDILLQWTDSFLRKHGVSNHFLPNQKPPWKTYVPPYLVRDEKIWLGVLSGHCGVTRKQTSQPRHFSDPWLAAEDQAFKALKKTQTICLLVLGDFTHATISVRNESTSRRKSQKHILSRRPLQRSPQQREELFKLLTNVMRICLNSFKQRITYSLNFVT